MPRFPWFVAGLPAVPGGNRPVRPEALPLGLKLLRRQEVPQAVGQRVAFANPVVLDRPHVEPAQLEDQEHFGGPAPDAADDSEARDDVLVSEPTDPSKRDGSIGDLRCEMS